MVKHKYSSNRFTRRLSETAMLKSPMQNSTSQGLKSVLGFTLIELMIVVAVIAILAAIAYPSYQEYVRKTKRVEMQTNLQDIAMNIQKYKIANFKVEGATPTDLGIASSYPTQGTALYNVSLKWIDGTDGSLKDTTPVGSEKWVLTATPISAGPQKGDGHVLLNYRGERCWTKATDINSGTACVPSASTNWDGR